ncbi:hypothetical protein PTKU46_47650 [Paraburkholderia terrae]
MGLFDASELRYQKLVRQATDMHAYSQQYLLRPRRLHGDGKYRQYNDPSRPFKNEISVEHPIVHVACQPITFEASFPAR